MNARFKRAPSSDCCVSELKRSGSSTGLHRRVNEIRYSHNMTSLTENTRKNMSTRSCAWFWVSSVLITVVVWSDSVCRADAPPNVALAKGAWVGNYHRTGPVQAYLTLSRSSTGAVTVSIVARGNPSPIGTMVATDCTVKAEGRPSDGTLAAMVVPLEANEVSVTAESLKDSPAHVKVQLDAGHLKVVSDYSGCGVGATLDGDYVPGGRGAILRPNRPLPVVTKFDITRAGFGSVAANATVAAVHATFAGAVLRAKPENDMVRIEIVGSGIAFGVPQAAAPSASKLSWDNLNPDTHMTFLETTSPRFSTAEGVRVGMTLSAVSQVLGLPKVVHEGPVSWAHFPLDPPQYPVLYRLTKEPNPKIAAIRKRVVPIPEK